ncbi:MAG: Fe-S cluster assembly protein IscX [Phycisphaerae bacterium]
MSGALKWTDSEDLAILLHEKFPELDPLTVRFTDLHDWVVALPGFRDDPKSSNEAKLEAIQMAWLDEYREARADDDE